jgi:type I restriction enzyme R subunit
MKIFPYSEADVEKEALEYFREEGYEVLSSAELSPDSEENERSDYTQILLQSQLLQALVRLNPHLPQPVLETVCEQLSKPDALLLLHNNYQFHRYLLEGVPVQYQRDEGYHNDRAYLIDFENVYNNRWVVTNQFTVKGAQQVRRLDLVVFVNGLPLALFEFKSPSDEDVDIWDAYNQFQTYKEDIPQLFVFNEALVISDGLNARVGSLTANRERFLPWRTIQDENDKPLVEFELSTLIRGFFRRELLLDYLRYFVIFEKEGDNLVKKLAAYHQFHAVREAVRVTILASRPLPAVSEPRASYGRNVVPGSKKAGVVWHTQGSGKSLTMCCYAGKLIQQAAMANPTLVLVTDRTDLDGQLFQTFANVSDLLKQTPIQAESREQLRQILAERDSGGIIFTTVQKFALMDSEEEHPILNSRHNLVVISDEAHRSQYGLKARFDQKQDKYSFGFAKHLRDALPNATFIGFTGTPISSEEKDTRAVFGDYISIYDIQDAVEDGATVPIYYESRLAKLNINQAEIEDLNNQIEEVIEEEEDLVAREKTKSTWSRLEKLVGAEPRIQSVAEDIVSHFESRNAIVDGKAMIVGMSREICVFLYDALVRLRPEWHNPDPEKGVIKIIMTGAPSDRNLFQPHLYSSKVKKRLEKRFKDPADPLKLVIVRDMWLTGFDAPCCHTMYIDKPMKGHNLMQAIARVNRVFKDKPGGQVVDYLGISNELKWALKTYTDARGKGEPALRTEEAYSILLEKLDILEQMYHGFDYSAYSTHARQLLIPAANHILGLKQGKKRYLDTVLAMNKAYSLCSTLEQVSVLREKIAFFTAVKTVISKFTLVEKKRSLDQRNSVLKQILDNALLTEGVEDIFSLAQLNKPDISVLSDTFLEEVRHLPQKNFAVELLEKLLKDAIRAKSKNNVVQERKYTDRLQDALRKYNNRAIEAAQVIEEIIQMAKDYREQMNREANLGLTQDEIAFYDALGQGIDELSENEQEKAKMTQAVLKCLAIELTDKLRKSTTIDWQVRESVRARLRILVRRTLQKFGYPPQKSDKAVELVLQQAETLSNAWTQ